METLGSPSKAAIPGEVRVRLGIAGLMIIDESS